MVPPSSVEQRLAVIEAAVAELQKHITQPESPSWLDQVAGSFKDNPDFEEVLALGREIRQGRLSEDEIQSDL